MHPPQKPPAPTSPERRRANLRNALRSTGPRTETGKRVSAENARLHGLSVPIGPGLGPQLAALAEIIEAEGIGREQARGLAARVMEFERNQSHEMEKLLKPQGLAPPTDERLAIKAMRLVWRIEARRLRENALGSDRYLRRSTNQLIKALRAL